MGTSHQPAGRRITSGGPRRALLLAALLVLCSSVAAAAPPEGARQQALDLHRSGDTAGAIAALETHLAAQPSDWPAAKMLAELVLASAPAPDAAKRLSVLAMRYPGQPDLLVLLGRAWEAAGDPSRAATAIEAAIVADDAARRPVDAERFMRLATLHAQTGNARGEAAALDRFVAVSPNDAKALERLVFLRERLGHHKDAQRGLLQLEKLAPRDPAIKRRLAESYVQTDQPFTAIGRYKEALDLEPAHVPTIRRLAQLYGWHDQPLNQLVMLQKLVRYAPSDVDAHVEFAEALYGQQKYRLAAAQMRRAVDLRPGDTQLSLRLATMLETNDDYTDAVRLLDNVHRADPGNREVKERLAMYHRDRGDNHIALGYYRELQNDDPDDPNIAEAVEDLEVLVRPRIGLGYEFTNDRNGLQGHEARVWLENQPSDFWRYYVGYRYSYYNGGSLLGLGAGERELQAHGAWLGVTMRPARYTTIDAQVSVNGYLNSYTFVGTRIGLVQRAAFPLEFRLWFERREDATTIDALAQETVVYDIHAQLDIEPVDRWLVEVGGSYGRWIHTDALTAARERNNGYGWYVGTGVRAIESPVTLEFVADYTGQAFDASSDAAGSRIPYFAPELYQTVGLKMFFEHQAHWRFLYRIYARPHWILEDEALQLDVGAAVEIKFHKRHWLELAYERTDTLVGSTENIFRENVVRAVYIGVF